MRGQMLVFTNPVEGRDAEYNDWYSNQHVADVCGVPGVLSGERFRLKSAGDGFRYLAIYQVETDDPDALLAEIRRRGGAGEFVRSDAIDMTTVRSAIFALL